MLGSHEVHIWRLKITQLTFCWCHLCREMSACHQTEKFAKSANEGFNFEQFAVGLHDLERFMSCLLRKLIYTRMSHSKVHLFIFIVFTVPIFFFFFLISALPQLTWFIQGPRVNFRRLYQTFVRYYLCLFFIGFHLKALHLLRKP